MLAETVYRRGKEAKGALESAVGSRRRWIRGCLEASSFLFGGKKRLAYHVVLKSNRTPNDETPQEPAFCFFVKISNPQAR